MRLETTVYYELTFNIGEGEIIEKFNRTFDAEIYDDDIDGTDWIAIGYKMQEIREKYGFAMLAEISIERCVLQ